MTGRSCRGDPQLALRGWSEIQVLLIALTLSTCYLYPGIGIEVWRRSIGKNSAMASSTHSPVTFMSKLEVSMLVSTDEKQKILFDWA